MIKQFSNYMDKPAGTHINFAWNPTKLGAIGGAVLGSLQGLPSQLDPETGEISNPGIVARATNIGKNALGGAVLGYGLNKGRQYIQSGAMDDILDPLKTRAVGLRNSAVNKVQPIVDRLPEVRVTVTKKAPLEPDLYDDINIPSFK